MRKRRRRSGGSGGNEQAKEYNERQAVALTLVTVTWNDVVEGVMDKLELEDPETELSGEGFDPELEEPQWFVQLKSGAQSREPGGRFRRKHAFDVQYTAPEASEPELHDVAEQLYDWLEAIELPDAGTVRGGGMKHEILQGVLHFYVEYALRVVRQDEDESVKMQQLEEEGFFE